MFTILHSVPKITVDSFFVKIITVASLLTEQNMVGVECLYMLRRKTLLFFSSLCDFMVKVLLLHTKTYFCMFNT